jgi:hypothetical protein
MGRLVIFPFDRVEMTIDLPSNFNGNIFSADGRRIYGLAGASETKSPPIVVATIKPPVVSSIKASQGLSYIKSVAADADGGILAVSAVYQHDGAQECGLFELNIEKGSIQHILNNPGGGCFDFVSSWNQLSLSPDGSRLIATAGSGQLAVINLHERRIEKTWPGAAAWWSPDGKSIAALTFESPSEIILVNSSDLSTRRTLGHDSSGRLQWSPDSRNILILDRGLCGVVTGYFGTLQVLDIETGQRKTISNSRCKVNLTSTGWVSDDMLN